MLTLLRNRKKTTTSLAPKQIDLYIDRLPRLAQGHSYKCVFNRSEQTSATQTANGLSCPLPKLMDRHKFIQIEPGKGESGQHLLLLSMLSLSRCANTNSLLPRPNI